MEKQINYQVSFNVANKSHRKLMEWIDEQTTNRSSFIRESLLMRMMGMYSSKLEVQQQYESDFDESEILKLIQV